ncbi:MAG TPA: wax ester/triacylglycerol synthase family O-acyltransferase [Candidatus Nanopelagicales bacterium]
MPDRLSPLDVSFLYMEEPTTPMHVGGVAIFEVPEGGFDYERLVRLIRDRISLVPRYRQRVRWVPGHLANPVWVDDERFDVTYHVRRSALPRPGTDEQLNELVGRIMSRPLDRDRPLWELYLVEGLEHGRFAVLSKTHHAMVDGIAAVDIGQVILDDTPEPREVPVDTWRPLREPSSTELVAAAVSEIARSPKAVVDTVRTGIVDVQETATHLGRNLVGLVAAARTMSRPARSGPLNASIGAGRRYARTQTRLEDLKRIKKAHGGTINDVVLTVLAGALRTWMMTRGESVTTRTSVRAMVPVSVRTQDDTSGNQIAAFLCDLPVGEPDPVIRLERVRFEMDMLKESGQMLGATALVGVASFTPPTVHSLGARVVSAMSRRVYNVVITNVPGPQFPLYAAGARMLAAHPVVPLARGQAVSIGLTSYDGGVYFGLNADREAMPDVEVLAQCIDDAVAEMLATVAPSGRPRRSRKSQRVADPQG